MLTILSVIGTRPEAIKLAPVIRALAARKDRVRSLVCVTRQHHEMLQQMLDFFGIGVDIDLDIMVSGQSLSSLTSTAVQSLQTVLDSLRPDWVVVQGDTTTAMTASLVAFYNRAKVAHVEAGLRTLDKHAPFPEEINRRLISTIADLHFAPTSAARDILIAERHQPDSIMVSGNTVIDSLFWANQQIRHGKLRPPLALAELIAGRRLVLVTAHRRENFDRGMSEICEALRDIADRYEDVVIVYPVHPNPNVREPAGRMLSGVPRIELMAPLDYGSFAYLLDRAVLILTDSGGIQEEASALGRPTIILRDVTERPEVLASGNAVLAGTRRDSILKSVDRILSNPSVQSAMSVPSAVFGKGDAGELIARRLISV